MIHTISNNPLDELVFKDDLDFPTLENILESLDHVIPKQVSREEFNRLKGDFLVETGEDTFGKKYDLFLPSDLQHGEKLNFVFFLSQKFGLENYTPYERIITQVKVMVSIILRNTQEEDIEAYVHGLASKYHLSEEFIERIKNEKMKLSEVKEMVREIKGKKAQEEKGKRLGSDEDIILGFEELKELFGEQFDLTFFRKGMNKLRLGMMTITGAEQETTIKYCEDNGFEKKNQSNGMTEYRKGKKTIVIHLSSEILDKEERLLRDKIGIDNFKKKLEQARKSGSREEMVEIEYEVSLSIIKVLYEYMYQLTEKHNGYQPSKIREQKEIYCVGSSLLGHAFLSELGIEHYGLHIFGHSALELVIGGKSYYFDATLVDKLIEFEYGEKKGEYHKIVGKGWEFSPLEYARKGNPEKILFSEIFNNKGCALSELGRYEEAIQMFNKSIELNTKSVSIYNNKGGILYNVGRYEEAIEMWDKSIELNPINSNTYKNKGLALEKLGKQKLSKMYRYASHLLEGKEKLLEISYRKEKRKIKDFMDSENYEGLRKYLIELEKEEN